MIPRLDIIQQFIAIFETKLAPVENWAVVGSGVSTASAHDVDLVLITDVRDADARWSELRDSWLRIQNEPPFDVAFLRMEDLCGGAGVPVTDQRWFLRYILFHQAAWQRGEIKLAPNFSVGGYYWALAERWWKRRGRAEYDLEARALASYLQRGDVGQEFPHKAAFMQSLSGDAPAETDVFRTLGALAVTNPHGALTPGETQRWLERLTTSRCSKR